MSKFGWWLNGLLMGGILGVFLVRWLDAQAAINEISAKMHALGEGMRNMTPPRAS